MASNETGLGTLARTEARNSDQLGCVIYSENSQSHRELQARRLCRLYAVTFDTACTLANLAYAAGCPR